jgi:hypothetical protein
VFMFGLPNGTAKAFATLGEARGYLDGYLFWGWKLVMDVPDPVLYALDGRPIAVTRSGKHGKDIHLAIAEAPDDRGLQALPDDYATVRGLSTPATDRVGIANEMLHLQWEIGRPARWRWLARRRYGRLLRQVS